METETLLAQYQHFMQDPALVRMHRDLLARMRAAARAMEQEGAGQWRVSALHTGELDVSHFSVVTPALQSRKGKYVVALLHGSLTFELWLCAANQKALDALRPLTRALPTGDQTPVPEDWAPFVAARWVLGGRELLQPEALTAEACRRLRAVDDRLAAIK